MNDNLNIGAALAAATCALLGSSTPANAADSAADNDRWSIDSSLLYYGESDDRPTGASGSSAA